MKAKNSKDRGHFLVITIFFSTLKQNVSYPERSKLVGRNVREKSVDDHETGLHPTASPEKN